jgi:hypothetical protein
VGADGSSSGRGKSKQSRFGLMGARFARLGVVGRGVGALAWASGTVISWSAGAGGPRGRAGAP